jgi:hypothetical protein
VRYVHTLVTETVINDWNVIQYNVGEHLHGLHGRGNSVEKRDRKEMMDKGRKWEEEVWKGNIDGSKEGREEGRDKERSEKEKVKGIDRCQNTREKWHEY